MEGLVHTSRLGRGFMTFQYPARSNSFEGNGREPTKFCGREGSGPSAKPVDAPQHALSDESEKFRKGC